MIIAFYLWKVVPTLAAVKEKMGESLSLPVRLQIDAAYWSVWLSPLIVAVGVALYLFRKKIAVPEFVRSGLRWPCSPAWRSSSACSPS